MNWTAKEMDVFVQQKDYIDTLIVPLVKIETTLETMKGSASASEFLMHLVTFVEIQFKGRMMFLPPITYTPTLELKTFAEALSQDLKQAPFKHIFFITTDHVWTSMELPGETIWLPSIPMENMDAQLRQSIMEDQLRQLLPKFTEKWSSQ